MKKNFFVILLIVGFITGLLLTWQFSAEVPLSGNFPIDEATAKKDLFKIFLDEQAYLQSRIVFLRNETGDAQKKIEYQSESSNVSLLDELKKEVGLSEISGAGLEITLDDSPFSHREGANITDTDLVQAADIRDIVNVLRASDSKAISVNNQRIIATSTISSVGTTLLVNNSYLAPPFVISAVGDTDVMIQRLSNKDLLASLYRRGRDSNIIFEISTKDFVTVPVYNGDLKEDHLNLIK